MRKSEKGLAAKRAPTVSDFVNAETLGVAGLTVDMVVAGLGYTYRILDAIDEKLLSLDASRLAKIIELANLSSIIGNLLGQGIANASHGIFQRNGPHKYPDLLGIKGNASDVEIKIALENQKPKGHLAKPGYYLTCRYVLCNDSGAYVRGKENRGDVVWIWEVRFGLLESAHFNLSNTPGDSGKTANVSQKGMQKLDIVYLDTQRCPLSNIRNVPTKRAQSLLLG